MTSLIAGILRLDGAAADPALVSRMLDLMAPEDKPTRRDIQTSGPAAMGVLTIGQTESEPPQPRVMVEGNLLLAADVRLYGTSDEPLETLARELRQNGAQSGRNLHGDFAFAAWDAEKLILGRDHFGVRPLQYTYRVGAYLAFASLPGAMLRPDLARRVLDAQALAAYPSCFCAIGERTFFRDIRSVLPSHTLAIRPGLAPQSHRYWRLPLGDLRSARSDREEVAREMLHLLDQATRRRLPAAGPGAGHISSGLDSTAIAVLAARALAPENREFLGFCYREPRDDPDLEIIDEWTHASAVAQREANIHLNGVGTPDQLDLMEALDPDLFLSLHPMEPEETVLRQASDAGASILLSGWGGDEIVTWRGHGNVAELFWSGQWGAMLDALRDRSERGGSSRFAIFRHSVMGESLPGPLRRLLRSRHGSVREEWEDIVAALAPAANRAALDSVPDREYGADSRIQRRGMIEHWWIPEQFQIFAQRGARHGVSYAFPMLDLDLLKFAITIPAVLLRDGDQDRAIFRRAMADVLPEMVRTKTRKSIPFPGETLRHAMRNPEMRDEVQRMAANPLVRKFIDTDGLIRHIDAMSTPDTVRERMNNAADRAEQVGPIELHHFAALYLAWYLDRHGTTAE